jgi:myo-inositol-1(or 4)-monophosphatase
MFLLIRPFEPALAGTIATILFIQTSQNLLIWLSIPVTIFLGLQQEFSKLLPELASLRNTAVMKNDDSPVSEADLLLDRVISNRLRSKWPDIVIFSEESQSMNSTSNGWVAIVDPLDGTENYISGLPIWGVCISIWNGGVHQQSGIFFPELKQHLVTGQPISHFKSRITGYPSSTPLEKLAIESNLGKESRILGCAAYNFYCVITGSFKSFKNNTGAHVWDILSGLNLALEHGCGVKVNGQVYRGEFLSSTRKHTFEVSR